MRQRSFGRFERLEDRTMFDGDPTLLELSPVVRGTIEKSAMTWAAVRDATTGTQVTHFESDQAGEQRHLWTETYYGWEGMTEFAPNLPEGATIHSATLRLAITNKVDTMNRAPNLVAYVSSQDQEEAIVTSEYRNATGNAIGSIAYAEAVPGQTVDMVLDPSAIPTNGNVSLSLRTSDQIAGQTPASDHNSRSVFYWSDVRLDIQYTAPTGSSGSPSAPSWTTYDVPRINAIAERGSVEFGEGLAAEVWTGWGSYGTTGNGGILRSVGSIDGSGGTTESPAASDHMILRFSQPLTAPTVVRLWVESSQSLPSIEAYGNGNVRYAIDAGGSITIDASPQHPVTDFSLVNRGTGKYGIDYFKVQSVVADEEAPSEAPATWTRIDIPSIRTIGEMGTIPLGAELNAQVGTGWGRYGTSSGGGILRSIGPSSGKPGNPDNPSAQDHVGLWLDRPITRPTVVHVWTEGISPTQIVVLMNNAEHRLTPNADGTVLFDATEEDPVRTMSFLNYTSGKVGVDWMEIQDPAVPEVPATGSMDVVSSENHRIQITFSSTADSTVFELRQNLGSPMHWGRMVVNHPGGIENGTVDFEPDWQQFGNQQASGVFSINMLDPMGVRLDRAFASLDWIGETVSAMPDEPPAIDPDSVREYEGDPSIAVESDGRLVFAWFASPYDSSYVEIVQDARSLEPLAWTGSAVVHHPGGTAGGFVQLAIPSSIPANATLTARVWDRRYGTLLAEQSFAQDEPIPDENRWEGMPPKTELVASLGNLEGNILNIQEQLLLERSGIITPSSVVEERLHEAYPHVFPADLAAEVELRYQAQPTYTRGWHEQSIINAQHDMLHAAMDGYFDYLDAMAPMIRRATQMWAAAYAGDDVTILDLQLEEDYAVARGCQYVDKPSYATLRATGKTLFLNQQAMFVQQARDMVSWNERQAYLAGEGLLVSESTMDALVYARQLASNHDSTLLVSYLESLDAGMRENIARLADFEFPEDTVATTGDLLLMANGGSLVPGIGGGVAILTPPDGLDHRAAFEITQGWVGPMTPAWGVETDSAMGRLFRGLLNQRNQLGITQSKEQLIAKFAIAQEITGISRYAFKYALMGTGSESAINRYNSLKELFIKTGYGHVFTEEALAPGEASMETDLIPHMVSIATDKNQYTQNENLLRVTFDYSDAESFEHANLYLVFNGEDMGMLPLTSAIKGQQFAMIPLSVIQEKLPPVIHGINVLSWINVRIRIQALDSNGNQLPNRTTLPFEVEASDRFDLSTNGDALRHQQENLVLNIVKDHFPVKNPEDTNWDTSNWTWDLGSGYHGNSEYFAMDLNRGQTDRGLPVYAVADGTIVSINGSLGSVVIEHVLPNGTKWRSESMHMLIFSDGSGGFNIQNANGDVIGHIYVNQQISQGSLIGTIGGMGNGNPYEFGPHIHSVFSLMQNSVWTSIDSRKVVESLGIKIFAYDAGVDSNPSTSDDNAGQQVIWSEVVNSFVPLNGTKVVYDRSQLLHNSNGSVPSYWLAWEGDDTSLMKKIVWDSDAGGWFEINDLGSYALHNGRRMKWVLADNVWQFLPE